jgi:predicted ArsR family transcriptional regulator
MNTIILTERGAELYTALLVQHDWMTSDQLAKATSKNVLSPHDRELLQRMVENRYVEIREVTVKGIGRPARMFKVVEMEK